jgi:hypothetical protein
MLSDRNSTAPVDRSGDVVWLGLPVLLGMGCQLHHGCTVGRGVPGRGGGLGSAGSPSTLEPDVIYDAANPGDTIVTATEEGLSIDTAIERHRLFASRAIRFVAA